MTKSYENYTLEEFITDDDFIQWAKYPTPAADVFWQNYLEKYPEQSRVVHHARSAVQQLALVSCQKAPVEETPGIWMTIEENLNDTSKRIYIGVNSYWRYIAAAACVLFVLGIGYWVTKESSQQTNAVYHQLVAQTRLPLREVVNNAETSLKVKMPDGSTVMLEPSSRISYNESFSGPLREIYLSGEAFFDVMKNPEKPCMVYANGLVTKVLGTSFLIRANEREKQVIVQVKTGRVSVFAGSVARNQDPETKGIVLTPNQRVTFGKEDERLTRSLVEKPSVILTTEELRHLSFENAPVNDIFAALKKAYGVDIVYDEEVMVRCRLTTSLTDETLFEKLDIICEGIEATYKVVDAQVIISGKGCN